MAYTVSQLGYARTIVRVGVSMGVSVRGLKIGLATGLVETNLLNYGNRAVPASLTVPHDAIGSDSKSVGIMQQQPQWWGRGDGIDLMDPATAARLFFDALAKLPYDDTWRSPGFYAQAVQRSSFPERYDERYPDAETLYALVTGDQREEPMAQYECKHHIYTNNDDGPRNTSNLLGIIIHTTENSGKTTAMDIARYQQSPEAGGSYNMLVDKFRNTVRSNDDNFTPWAAGSWTANSRYVHISVVGQAKTDRAGWLGEYGPALATLAEVVKHTARLYNIPLVKLTAAQLKAGVKGVAGHNECSQAFGGSNHWDPGPEFPYDILFQLVQGNTPAPKPEGFLMALTDSEQRELYDAICHPRPSLVEGSTALFDHATYAQLTDAATYRTEQAVENIGQRLARIEKKLEAK